MINQTISPFPEQLPDRSNPQSFEIYVKAVLDAIKVLTEELPVWTEQVNSTQQEINNSESEIEANRQIVENIKTLVEQIRDDVENSKDYIFNYNQEVIEPAIEENRNKISILISDVNNILANLQEIDFEGAEQNITELRASLTALKDAFSVFFEESGDLKQKVIEPKHLNLSGSGFVKIENGAFKTESFPSVVGDRIIVGLSATDSRQIEISNLGFVPQVQSFNIDEEGFELDSAFDDSRAFFEGNWTQCPFTLAGNPFGEFFCYLGDLGNNKRTVVILR